MESYVAGLTSINSSRELEAWTKALKVPPRLLNQISILIARSPWLVKYQILLLEPERSVLDAARLCIQLKG
ncbi:hypothetical protein KSP39_PZI015917 [Platanthera zijinensis]|uniref:Uncharacterized protein n=1 Tax=Platanthera zijinensis TaxID=2320716 RepID=A0AAP0B9A9_9ASPA